MTYSKRIAELTIVRNTCFILLCFSETEERIPLIIFALAVDNYWWTTSCYLRLGLSWYCGGLADWVNGSGLSKITDGVGERFRKLPKEGVSGVSDKKGYTRGLRTIYTYWKYTDNKTIWVKEERTK